jgi:hypothetical protein
VDGSRRKLLTVPEIAARFALSHATCTGCSNAATSPRAVACLLKLVDGEGPLALRAAEAILDRAWGAPGQEKDVHKVDDVLDLNARLGLS